jgi:invasion protein IalB
MECVCGRPAREETAQIEKLPLIGTDQKNMQDWNLHCPMLQGATQQCVFVTVLQGKTVSYTSANTTHTNYEYLVEAPHGSPLCASLLPLGDLLSRLHP